MSYARLQIMKIEYVPQPLILRRVRHSRMLLAGIQAKFGLDPRLKHSGVTELGVASLHPPAIFEGERTRTRSATNLASARVMRARVVGRAADQVDDNSG
jgi:hypothetical protein